MRNPSWRPRSKPAGTGDADNLTCAPGEPLDSPSQFRTPHPHTANSWADDVVVRRGHCLSFGGGNDKTGQPSVNYLTVVVIITSALSLWCC